MSRGGSAAALARRVAVGLDKGERDVRVTAAENIADCAGRGSQIGELADACQVEIGHGCWEYERVMEEWGVG